MAKEKEEINLPIASTLNMPKQKVVDLFRKQIEQSMRLSKLRYNAIERCFRHIAMGRRNWIHTGSHFAAEKIAFIYSLVESCKLNKIEFGEYIEDILTRFMNGEDAEESFLPNHYTPRLVCEQKIA